MRRWIVALALGAQGCAALEDWDRFSGGASPPSDDAASDAGPGGEAGPGDAGIALVQANAVAADNMSRRSVDVPFKNPQGAGDLNVVVIGWFDLGVSLANVVDSAGNPYQAAGPPASVSGSDPIEQVIYFAPRVAAAVSNVVTVTFDSPACSPDIRVLEFSGVSTLDVSAGASGTSGAASVTAAVPTKHAPELIVGGGSAAAGFSVADPPYTLAIISEDLDIAEYRVVDDVGTYTASAPLPNKSWVMQLATFY
jgi:hypothetical protein